MVFLADPFPSAQPRTTRMAPKDIPKYGSSNSEDQEVLPPTDTKFQRRNTFLEDDEGVYDNDFMQRIVDGPCQGYLPVVDAPCQSVLPACQATIEQQLDLLTHCRQPLGFLSFFKEHDDPTGELGVEVLPVGMYVPPTFCEYCGNKDWHDCNDSCRRPKLFFQKKRPPFCPPDPTVWVPETDHWIPQPTKTPAPAPTLKEDVMQASKRRSWVSGLFGAKRK